MIRANKLTIGQKVKMLNGEVYEVVDIREPHGEYSDLTLRDKEGKLVKGDSRQAEVAIDLLAKSSESSESSEVAKSSESSEVAEVTKVTEKPRSSKPEELIKKETESPISAYLNKLKNKV